MQKRQKEQDFLTPEEVDVQQALKAYTVAEDLSFSADWVSTTQLYETYRRWFEKRPWFPDDPELLTVREFGAALRRVFPVFEEDDERRLQVTINGKRIWGFTGVSGPGSTTFNPQRGRPKDSDKAAAASTKVPGRSEMRSIIDDYYEDPCREAARSLRSADVQRVRSRMARSASGLRLPADGRRPGLRDVLR